MKLTLNPTNVQKVLTGAVLAGVGGMLTFLIQNSAGIDFGAFGPVVGAVLSVAANYVRKLIEEQSTNA